jgi:hypothetical protein
MWRKKLIQAHTERQQAGREMSEREGERKKIG